MGVLCHEEDEAKDALGIEASNAYLAAGFLRLVCDPECMDDGLLLLVSGASEEQKQSVIAHLMRIGAIEHVGSTWAATANGRQIDAKLSHALAKRFA